MNKAFIYTIVFLLSMFAVTAITIDGVTITDTDNFYSNYTGNNIVHLSVNVSNLSVAPGNNVSVIADFTNLGVNCGGAGTGIVNLTNSSGSPSTWNVTCDVGDEAAVSNFASGPVIITATESYGATSVNNNTVISLYNMTIPTGNSCFGFTTGTTNFTKDVSNFGSFTLTLVVQLNGSCITGGWGTGFVTVSKLTFTSLNLATPTAAAKLANLASAIQINVSPAKTFQNSRVYINEATFAEITNSPTTIELYHLPLTFAVQPNITKDNSSRTVTFNSWASNGFEAFMNATTGNLTFQVNGFSGYNITDVISPTIIFNTPLINGLVLNSSTVIINVTLNGTGTELSSATFSANGVLKGNLSNCTQVGTTDIYNCFLNFTQPEGNYNLTITATDFGAGSGNTATSNSTYYVQSGPPALVVTNPLNNSMNIGTNGSMLKLNFSATDGNSINYCYYNLTGTINQTIVGISNCSGAMSIQLYLANGTYTLNLFANDTLGKYNSTTLNFTVNDTTPPVIVSNTASSSAVASITLSVTTDENATCKYDTADVTFDSMGYPMTDSFTTHSTTASVASSGSTYYVRCVDMSNNTNPTSYAIVVSYTGGSGSGSGGDGGSGGGGGGSSGDSTDNTPTDATWNMPSTSLTAGTNPINVDYYKGIPIKNIALITNTAIGSVSISIATVSSPSTTYTEKVYKYLQVDHADVDDSQIDSAKIRFRIEKTWLSSNNKNKTDIVLLRYKNSTWNPLSTSIVDEDDTYVNYIADSPGLSLFAISTKAPVVTTTGALNNATASANNGTNSTNTTNNPNDNLKKPYNWTWTIIIAVLIIIVILFILVQRNERNSPPPIFPEERTVVGKLKRLFK